MAILEDQQLILEQSCQNKVAMAAATTRQPVEQSQVRAVDKMEYQAQAGSLVNPD